MSTSVEQHGQELLSGERFGFGANWARFLRRLNDERILDATESLAAMLDASTLQGHSFIDVGSGSGLFSLAAHRLGARVVSFDYDPESVACTEYVKRKYAPNSSWVVERGSILDANYVGSLGKFDVVYSWGVLHHTGKMWEALEMARSLVAPGGKLFIAIYNDQGLASKYWTFVKRTYNKVPITAPFWTLLHGLYPTLPSVLLKTLRGKKTPRGMNPWVDLKDWLGGYPFEVATPGQIAQFYEPAGFRLIKSTTVGRKMGCNEFVFQRSDNPG